MVWKYIRTPWASGGDRTPIPNDAQPDGSASQTEGFGIDYQLDPGTDPDAKNVPRDTFNESQYDSQTAIQQLQQDGFPMFINPSDNGGSAFAYKAGAVARYANGWAGAAEMAYYSLVDANVANPTDQTKWGLVVYGAQFVTGDVMDWNFSTIRAGGWVWMNGTTIGNAASNATGRANADTAALFSMLWADYPTNLKIYNSAGVETTRGANAAADFAANKAIAMLDRRERTPFGRGDMGGAASPGRITNARSGISGTSMGASGGAQTVQLTGNQNGTHIHTGSTGTAGLHYHGGNTDSAGSHNHKNGTPGTDVGFNPYVYGSTTADLPGLANIRFSQGSGAITFQGYTSTDGVHSHLITTSTDGSHSHSVTTDNSGLGSDHQNMPPAIISGGWIMKL